MVEIARKLVDRRQFLKAGSGLCFTFFLPAGAFQVQAGSSPGKALSAWVHISDDNEITIASPAAELGQGSMTAIPMIFAEELDADWKQVRIEFSAANDEIFMNPTPWVKGIMLTLGSSAVSGYYDSVRLLGAQARKILLLSVARHWKVPLSELTSSLGMVHHDKSARRMTYGEIISQVSIIEDLPEIDPSELKPEENFNIIGSDIPRYDIPDKVNGKSVYSIDVDLPGMLYAAVIHSPVKGASPLSVDNENEIVTEKDVLRIVQLPEAVAIVAKTYESAYLAEKKLEISWSKVDRLHDYSDARGFETHLAMVRNDKLEGMPIQKVGNTDSVLENAGKKYEAEYLSDYFYHAHLEPLNSVARVNNNKTVDVWAGTQAPTHCTRVIAEELGISVENVRLHRTFMGGAFGRRGGQDHDFVIDAVQLSREMNAPVKVIWSREADIKAGRFKPIKAIRMQAAENDQGRIVAWRHRTASDEALKQSDPYRYEKVGGWPVISSGGMEIDYDIENISAEMLDPGVILRAAPMRGIGGTVNKFAGECFLDEIAMAKGQDPLDIRMKLLSRQDTARRVLATVAEMSGWHERKEKSGFGLAFQSAYYPTAYVVQLTLNRRSGVIRVQKVWVALDVGIAIHPRNIVGQLEGQIIFAVSNALKERITVTNGVVDQSNFHDYPIMRMNEIPDIEVSILTRENSKPLGVGDSRCEIIPAAIGNAFADLTGKRLRHLPFIPSRVIHSLNS